MVLQDARDKNLDRGAILAHVFWAIVDLFCLTLGVLVFLTLYRASELWASLRANFNNKETEHRWRKCALICLAVSQRLNTATNLPNSRSSFCAQSSHTGHNCITLLACRLRFGAEVSGHGPLAVYCGTP